MSIRKEQAFIQEMLPEAKAKREAALKRLAEDGQQIESDTAGPVSKCPCCQSVEVECCNCAAQFSLAPVAQHPQEPRKPLTEAQIDTLWLQRDCLDAIKAGDILAQVRSFARAIEAAHGIGEEGK